MTLTIGYTSVGLELDSEYFGVAQKAIPRLAAPYPQFKGQEIEIELNGTKDSWRWCWQKQGQCTARVTAT